MHNTSIRPLKKKRIQTSHLVVAPDPYHPRIRSRPDVVLTCGQGPRLGRLRSRDATPYMGASRLSENPANENEALEILLS